MFIHLICLSVSARFNSPKYIRNLFMFFLPACSMDHIQNGMYRTNGLCLQRHTKYFRYITAYGEGNLRHILIYLDGRKCNEINICHSDIEKNVS